MPPRLNRDVIVAAAFEVLDDEGIEGLTVRALAARLGVKAPALYWHLESKQALLDEMGTEVARRIQRSLARMPADAGLGDALRAYADAARAEYLRHRDGARTFSGTRLTDPELLRVQEAALARWAAQGHPVESVADAFEIVTAFVVGFVIEEQERALSGEGRYDLAARDAVLGDDHPLTVAAGHRLFADPGARFAQHLDRILPALIDDVSR
ncbi:MAG: TetR/AcrR family transcriptional regulator C-terminal domain-containing protein [Microbacterium sp.]